MCGIAGTFDLKAKTSNVNDKILQKMSDVIIHRGPDAEGQWISRENHCGLAFRRLSIIDLSNAGNQPMHSDCGNYSIVFNGEIYNHLEIRNDLINKGYSYHSKTDTETILNGYKEFGEDILPKMIGMWGFAIWNEQKKELFAARDRIGIKPFYYYYENGVFVFGSEIKSILEHPAVKKEVNFDEIPMYLSFSMTGNKNSLFKNIHKLPAGHSLKLSSDGKLTIKRFWSPFEKASNDLKMSDKDIQNEIIRLLRQAVKDRMMSDVPFGVFLSGGVDSSLNVALMAELMDRPVDTFTVGFKELEKYNELEYARLIADRYKTNHHEILIDHNDALPILGDLAWHEDEPNSDPVCIPLYFLSKLTRESGTTVVQVGEGSDEQFIGYSWMLRDLNFHNSYWSYFKKLPQFVKLGIYKTVKPLFMAQKQFLALDYIRRATYNEEYYWSGSSIFPPCHMEILMQDKYKNNILKPAFFAHELHRQALALKEDADYLQRMTYTELTNRLAELLLMRVDKIGMANSIEARVPFLDHRLVEFTMSIPTIQKVPDKTSTKILLKKAVEGILPNDIIYRKKQGFAAPVKEWLKNEWYGYAYDEIMNSELSKEIFNLSRIKSILETHKNTNRNFSNQIFTLLMLSLWYKKFFKN